MRYILSIVFLGMAFSGCANITYTSPSGGSFRYTRYLSQKLNNFKFEKSVDGSISVSLEKQEGDAGILAESVNNISQLMLRMAGAYAGIPVPPVQPQPTPTPEDK